MSETELRKRMMLLVPDLDKREKAHEKRSTYRLTGEQQLFIA
jgi:hypothetical protein